MPSKGFKKEAIGVGNALINITCPTPIEVVPANAEKPKNKGGRPKGSTKKTKLAKDVRDKILQRFRIDEFLELVDTDPRVKRYFYLELIPKMLPRMSEKEVEEKFGVSFYFGDESKSKSTKQIDRKKEEKELPMSLILTDAPLPEGLSGTN